MSLIERSGAVQVSYQSQCSSDTACHNKNSTAFINLQIISIREYLIAQLSTAPLSALALSLAAGQTALQEYLLREDREREGEQSELDE